MKKVTGIGGIFFKCKDTTAIKNWYKNHLGIDAGEYGAEFKWKENDTDSPATTVWSPFSETTDYFDPGKQSFMINYRVENLHELIKQLESEGVKILATQNESYGKFAWIMDPEGNKIELWEDIGKQ